MNVIDLFRGKRVRRMPVLVCGDPVLRRKSEAIEEITEDVRDLAERMVVTMFENDVPGVGLAAPQVGVNIRMIALATHNPEEPVPVDASPGEQLLSPRMPVVMVNPEIVAVFPERCNSVEGCLSIPEVSGEVERPANIVVRATLLDGEVIQVPCGGLLSRCIQHEIDHLDGILFIDHLDPAARAAIEPKIQDLEQKVRKDLGKQRQN